MKFKSSLHKSDKRLNITELVKKVDHDVHDDMGYNIPMFFGITHFIRQLISALISMNVVFVVSILITLLRNVFIICTYPAPKSVLPLIVDIISLLLEERI